MNAEIIDKNNMKRQEVCLTNQKGHGIDYYMKNILKMIKMITNE